MPDVRRAYRSDLSGTEWAILAPRLPPPAPCGRPRKWPARPVADAVFSVLRSGCAWRMLPREFPPSRLPCIAGRPARLGHCRRLSKDYERLPAGSEAMIYGAMSRLMLRRLTQELPSSFPKPFRASCPATYPQNDAVPPGGTHTYVYASPERAGPGPQAPSSVLWMYHSHVDEPRDGNAGLVGPSIITARGRARADGRPKDVDREYVTLFMVFDENKSWYLEDNIANTPGADPEDEDEFEEANLKHAINGYIFGNLPLEDLTMRLGERVRWYVFGMGTEVDLHTPHWHAQTLLWQGMRVDVVDLLPAATLRVLDMEPDNPGIWLYHCHVDDHIAAGMLARFRVLPQDLAGGGRRPHRPPPAVVPSRKRLHEAAPSGAPRAVGAGKSRHRARVWSAHRVALGTAR